MQSGGEVMFYAAAIIGFVCVIACMCFIGASIGATIGSTISYATGCPFDDSYVWIAAYSAPFVVLFSLLRYELVRIAKAIWLKM
jgi:hypothetical protein